jgi:hypothetical protein
MDAGRAPEFGVFTGAACINDDVIVAVRAWMLPLLCAGPEAPGPIPVCEVRALCLQGLPVETYLHVLFQTDLKSAELYGCMNGSLAGSFAKLLAPIS